MKRSVFGIFIVTSCIFGDLGDTEGLAVSTVVQEENIPVEELRELQGSYQTPGFCDFSSQKCTTEGFIVVKTCPTRPADQSWPHNDDDLFPGVYCVVTSPPITNRCAINTFSAEFNDVCGGSGGPGCRLDDSLIFGASNHCAWREDWICLTQTVLIGEVRHAVCNCSSDLSPGWYPTAFGWKECSERPPAGGD